MMKIKKVDINYKYKEISTFNILVIDPLRYRNLHRLDSFLVDISKYIIINKKK